MPEEEFKSIEKALSLPPSKEPSVYIKIDRGFFGMWEKWQKIHMCEGHMPEGLKLQSYTGSEIKDPEDGPHKVILNKILYHGPTGELCLEVC